MGWRCADTLLIELPRVRCVVLVTVQCMHQSQCSADYSYAGGIGDCGSDMMLSLERASIVSVPWAQNRSVEVQLQVCRVLLQHPVLKLLPQVPSGARAVYFNLSKVYAHGTITDAFYDRDERVSLSAVSERC